MIVACIPLLLKSCAIAKLFRLNEPVLGLALAQIGQEAAQVNSDDVQTNRIVTAPMDHLQESENTAIRRDLHPACRGRAQRRAVRGQFDHPTHLHMPAIGQNQSILIPTHNGNGRYQRLDLVYAAGEHEVSA